MFTELNKADQAIHHHAGGLEIGIVVLIRLPFIHHHAGGLETSWAEYQRHELIHHHAGGLEKLLVIQLIWNIIKCLDFY